MKVVNDTKLDFDDVLIRPKRSQAGSRKHVDLNRTYAFKNNPGLWEGIPIIASNMDSVGTMAMAKALAEQTMGTCLHKHYSVEELVDFYAQSKTINVFYTIGIKAYEFDKLETVQKKLLPTHDEVLSICIDAANGYTEYFVQRVREIRKKYPVTTIMAGNVATPEMVQELLLEGADIIKIGIGPGSVCRTRHVTGVGYPQLSAVIECADAAHGLGGLICADGGCKTPGDVVKAFGAGADFVMLGGMLAAHEECEGQWEVYKGDKARGRRSNKKSFQFYGMSSREAMEKHNGGLGDYRAAEGKCIEIEYKGPVRDTLQEITGGLRSACTYVGADRLKDFSKCCTFIQVNRTHK